ncbi:tetratricopeptide repeat protein [candidate division TA06 bacterium]|nr:tetratricopeptide repeat protein [candidate division TA06 bacterium]
MIPVKDQNKIKDLFVRALWGYSDMQEKLRGFKPAVDGFLRLSRYAKSWGDPLHQGLALAEAGYRAAKGAEYGTGETRLLEALSILEKSGRDADLAVCRKYLAFVHTMQGRFAQALEDTEDSLAAYLRAGDREGWAAVVNNKGNILQRTGQTEEAGQCFRETLESSRAIGNIFLESAALSNLAIFHARQDQNEEALKYQLEVMVLRHKMDDLVGLASGLLNLGNIYHMLGRRQEGMECWEQAEATSARLGDFSTVASIKFNRAELCDALGDPDKAFGLYEQAMTIRIERGETQDLPQSVIMWAETAAKLGKLDEALKTRAAGLLQEVLKMENIRDGYGEKARKLLEEINGSK